MKKSISLHWFRHDLRIIDNPSLNFLSTTKNPIVCLYIFDNENCNRQLGAASKVWLHHSLHLLNRELEEKLLIFKGNPRKIFEQLLQFFVVKNVSWNVCYEPWQLKRDQLLKDFLKKKNVITNTFNASLLWDPAKIVKDDGTPYKVFTPYYKRLVTNSNVPRFPVTKKFSFFKHNYNSLTVNDLNLLTNKKWESKIFGGWSVGTKAGINLLDYFFDKNGIVNYKHGRNYPNQKNVTRLSPYIHWGQVSPNLLWYKTDDYLSKVSTEDIKTFKSQLCWREFSYYLLYHFSSLPNKNLQSKFDKFPWLKKNKNFDLWCKGLTGYPIVDAGMRELWKTGYMHNRVRMITGSFLVKNLLHHWRYGERWFWDCLFDADLANNSASWQWVAGCGTDYSPYFRIFNPVIQGKKFDPNGKYVKKFIPELNKLPLKYLFSPWKAPDNILTESSVKLGVNYPYPLVSIKESREKALLAFSLIRN